MPGSPRLSEHACIYSSRRSGVPSVEMWLTAWTHVELHGGDAIRILSASKPYIAQQHVKPTCQATMERESRPWLDIFSLIVNLPRRHGRWGMSPRAHIARHLVLMPTTVGPTTTSICTAGRGSLPCANKQTKGDCSKVDCWRRHRRARRMRQGPADTAGCIATSHKGSLPAAGPAPRSLWLGRGDTTVTLCHVLSGNGPPEGFHGLHHALRGLKGGPAPEGQGSPFWSCMPPTEAHDGYVAYSRHGQRGPGRCQRRSQAGLLRLRLPRRRGFHGSGCYVRRRSR